MEEGFAPIVALLKCKGAQRVKINPDQAKTRFARHHMVRTHAGLGLEHAPACYLLFNGVALDGAV